MNILPVSGGFTIPKGFILFKFPGEQHFEEAGHAENFEISVEVERDDLDDNRYGVSRTVDSQVTSVSVTWTTTLLQQTNRNRALGMMGSERSMQQDSATALTMTFTDVIALKHYDLERFEVSNVVVTDGTETLVPGVDYYLDTTTGNLQPARAFPTLEVTYGCAAILPASNRLKVGIGGNTEIEVEVKVIGNAKSGPKPHVHLWKSRVTPDGSRGLISTERAGIGLTGTCLADPARALAAGDVEEYAFGIEQTL